MPVICLAERDILFYLDDQVCRETSPAFPGWHQAYAALEHRPDRNIRKWKQWISVTYSLDLSSDGVRTLAVQCKRQGRIPQELSHRVQELTRLAESSLVSGS